MIRYFSWLGFLREYSHKGLVISNREPEAPEGNNALFYRRSLQKTVLGLIGMAVLVTVFPELTGAQTEVTANIYRYRERERKSNYYQKYEFKPISHLPFVERQNPQTELIAFAQTAEKVRSRKYLADAHLGLRFYKNRTCIRCHPLQDRNLHTARLKITCRQCHGDEPIAGISHYHSSMNPRRRYAFICAKCHKGSNPSFASYVVHEPSPISMSTRKTFPLLFYVFWGMIALAAGTFAAFLPHALIWGLREFLPDSFKWDLSSLILFWRKKR